MIPAPPSDAIELAAWYARHDAEIAAVQAAVRRLRDLIHDTGPIRVDGGVVRRRPAGQEYDAARIAAVMPDALDALVMTVRVPHGRRLTADGELLPWPAQERTEAAREALREAVGLDAAEVTPHIDATMVRTAIRERGEMAAALADCVTPRWGALEVRR